MHAVVVLCRCDFVNSALAVGMMMSSSVAPASSVSSVVWLLIKSSQTTEETEPAGATLDVSACRFGFLSCLAAFDYFYFFAQCFS